MKKPFEYEKILTYYKAAQMIQDGHMPSPRMALIYPSYVCGHHCPGCHYKEWNQERQESGFMDYDKFCGLVESLTKTGVEAIEFCGGGEPTMHPQFDMMIDTIRKAGMRFGMFTNAQGIDQTRAERLVDMASYIRVSIDQEAEWKAIERLCAAKKDATGPCLIGTKILVSGINQKDLRSKISRCLKIGADYVQIKPEKPTRTEFTDREKHMMEEEIQNYKNRYPGQIFGGLDHTELKGKCWLSPIHTMIDVYGDVYICCYFQFREKSHKIGNCFGDQNFDQIWYSDRHQEAIDGIQKKECDVFDCRYHGYNSTMKEALESGHLEFS